VIKGTNKKRPLFTATEKKQLTSLIFLQVYCAVPSGHYHFHRRLLLFRTFSSCISQIIFSFFSFFHLEHW